MRERVARQDMREHALELMLARASEEGGVSHLASALKVAGSTIRQDRQELLVDALGLQSLVEETDSGAAGFGATDLQTMAQVAQRDHRGRYYGDQSQCDRPKRILHLPAAE